MSDAWTTTLADAIAWVRFMGRMARGEPSEGVRKDWQCALDFIHIMPQPVVVAIEGQAWGGGCELALACAFRLASPNAHFAQMEMALERPLFDTLDHKAPA